MCRIEYTSPAQCNQDEDMSVGIKQQDVVTSIVLCIAQD